MALKLDKLKEALATLKEAIELHQEKQSDTKLALALRDSVIQRFEYTYELAWKIMQRWLATNVSPEASETVYSRKELFRLAAKWKIIDDPLRWFKYNEARNISAHTYDEDNAEQVFQAALGLVIDVKYLINQLEKHHD